MNKTGLKTFACSFVITLFAIVGVNRAFFYTPKATETEIKIPRKNITLFFSHPQTYSSSVVPVQKVALNTPDFKPEELKIAQNMPVMPKEFVVEDLPELIKEPEIPLQIMARQEGAETNMGEEAGVSDVPLVYAGVEKQESTLNNARQDVEAEMSPPKVASIEEESKEPLSDRPRMIKASRQIVRIDNVNNQRQILVQEEMKEPQKLVSLAGDGKSAEEEIIPLQENKAKELLPKEDLLVPAQNQIANLGEEEPLAEAEAQLVEDKEDSSRTWQTMAEKHHDKNPWVVARGSKFVKNKKVLQEGTSKLAEQKAENILSQQKIGKKNTVKVAVQDNLLIPIPQELLDEDNLVPDVSDDKNGSTKPLKSPKVKKEKSFLNSLTSVFSKENREKAIKNIKEKSNRMLKEDKEKTQILPTEIRLSFQPNRAEISGQTLRWIQAFAKKAVDEDGVGLEIRIDGSRSFELQQKRLNLLYNILTANGLSYQKINTVFADREPNSFVVRTVKILQDKGVAKEDDSWKQYYQKW